MPEITLQCLVFWLPWCYGARNLSFPCLNNHNKIPRTERVQSEPYNSPLISNELQILVQSWVDYHENTFSKKCDCSLKRWILGFSSTMCTLI